MNKLQIKFTLSLILLINTIILIVFFENIVYIIDDYLYPLFFLYFLYDSAIVMLPQWNKTIYSSKMEQSNFIEIPGYDKQKLIQTARKNNRIALLVFVLYVLGILIVGFLYWNIDWIDEKYIYLVFFGLNFADYFCILIWCPFKSWFFKNTCCNTCRISNWDRIMKFSVLIFIPNVYTITIFILGGFIFLYWEYQHTMHPERFYRISNELLWCKNCDISTCSKYQKKE